jgi:hypothetical protein
MEIDQISEFWTFFGAQFVSLEAKEYIEPGP